MTDRSSTAGEAAKPAHFRIRRGPDGSDQISRYGGPWETVNPEPVSDDPAVNAVGKMSLRQNKAIADDVSHPAHAAVVEYNRLLMEKLRPTFDAIFRAGEPGRLVADAIDRASEQSRRAAAAILKANEPSRRAADEVAKATGRGRRVADAILKAQGNQPAAALAAQHYKDLVADALPELPTSTLVKLPGAGQASSEAGENNAEPPRKGEIPQASEAVADLLREQNEMLGAQAETLTELVEQQKQLLEVERAKTTAAQQREKTATKDARHNKHLARWGLAATVASLAVAVITLAVTL